VRACLDRFEGHASLLREQSRSGCFRQNDGSDLRREGNRKRVEGPSGRVVIDVVECRTVVFFRRMRGQEEVRMDQRGMVVIGMNVLERCQAESLAYR
jgi:hypothetical protein